MLVIAGLGLCDEKDLTLRIVEQCKKADKIYLETYTNLWLGSKKKLEKLIGKRVVKLTRKDVEEGYEKILEQAANSIVVLLVPGDPFVATTHSFLIREAKNKKIGIKVLHNASIISAVWKSGLHPYKLGGVVTIPLQARTKNAKPTSIIQKIKTNKKLGLHTICLLDIIVDERKYVSVKRAIEFLLKEKAILEQEKIVVFSRIGCKDEKIVYAQAKKLLKKKFKLPACLIIPSNLHFSEEAVLKCYEL